MDDPQTKSYTMPRQPPAPDVLVLGAAKATSYGPRAELYDNVVVPVENAKDAMFWAVYEWRPSKNILEGGWWEWLADCDTEDVARTLAEAIARDAQHPGITHCDRCGCDWLDNGLNPIGCPYCKQQEG